MKGEVIRYKPGSKEKRRSFCRRFGLRYVTINWILQTESKIINMMDNSTWIFKILTKLHTD